MSAEERIFRALSDPERQEAIAFILENADALRDLVAFLAELKNSGVLELLTSGVAAIKALMADLITSRDFAERAGRLLEVLSTAEAVIRSNGAGCVAEAASRANAGKPAGIYGILEALQDPDVQRGIGYLLSFVKSLGACLGRQ